MSARHPKNSRKDNIAAKMELNIVLHSGQGKSNYIHQLSLLFKSHPITQVNLAKPALEFMLS